MKVLFAIILIGGSSMILACENWEARKHHSQGITYAEQGRFDEASAEFKRAISIDSDNAKVHYNLGAAYEKQGKYDLAVESCQKAIAINPDDAKAHYNLSCVYALKNETNLSIESLQKAVILNKIAIEAAKTESDFDNIRSSPEFQQLINSVE